MPRVHFFEAIERENDYQKEYIKLENLCAETCEGGMYSRYFSINSWLQGNFRMWDKRSNYTSYNELREQLGFPDIDEYNSYYKHTIIVDLNIYLLYCEMVLNLIMGLKDHFDSGLNEITQLLFDTIEATIAKAGLEIRKFDDEIMIVEKNATAIEVADKVPELADVVIEYNHYLLRGDLARKKELLRQLADALEPKRNTLKSLNKGQTEDFFQLVNSKREIIRRVALPDNLC